MSKIKLNPGLASIILLACLFSGWSTLLTVSVLMLLFCEVDDKIKGIAVKVIAFYAGITLVSMAWGLIYDGVDLIVNSIDKLIATINCYLEYPNLIDITKLKLYLISPVQNLLSIADGAIAYLLVFAKFGFIIATLGNKAVKENIVVKKINEFVAKVVNYINSIDVPAQQPVQQAQPVQPTNPIAGQ